MSMPEKIDNALDIVIDVATNALYLAGIAVIELVLRPLFGAAGVPTHADWVLTLGDLVLILTLFRKLIVAADKLFLTIAQSWTVKSLVQQLRQKSALETVDPGTAEAPASVSPRGAMSGMSEEIVQPKQPSQVEPENDKSSDK